jgi:hypothetical protein
MRGTAAWPERIVFGHEAALLEMAGKRGIRGPNSHGVFGQARGPSKMFRAGLYARVSTNDQQTIPLQMRALREYAARRGWTVVLQVREVGSGAAARELREKIVEAARRRQIDVVLVWRLDRWGRSVTDLLATLQELEHLGVGSSGNAPKLLISRNAEELGMVLKESPLVRIGASGCLELQCRRCAEAGCWMATAR